MLRMVKNACLVTASLMSLGALATPAVAQSAVCGERSAIIDRLQSKYGETRLGLGVGRENGVVEIYTSETTGSWTILMTLPTGMTCLMAAGEAWEDVAEATQTGDDV